MDSNEDTGTWGGWLFWRMRQGAIVSFVRASSAMRARFVVSVLSLALLCASTCSTTCATCLDKGAGAAVATESHACGQASPDAGGGSHKRGPAKPDCFGHHQYGFEFVRSDAVMQIQLSPTGHERQLIRGAVRAQAAVEVASFRSDLAPPRQAGIFPQQKSSILRI